MPGPGTHVLVSDKVIEQLAGMRNWRYRSPADGPNPTLPPDLAEIAAKNPNYYALGAVGPDFFFFLPDFRNHLASPLIGVVHLLDDLYAKLDSWILEDWERYFGPGSENVDEAISRLTGDLSSVVSEILGDLGSLLSSALIDLVAQSHDWWGLFSLGLDVGYDNKDFFWSDMLHYRKTSLFAHNLWAIAEEWAARPEEDAALWSDRLKAYALGYMTHVATDTTGHAFVNEKCGGPFRTHWQRHHLIENHMDAKTYDDEHGTDTNYNMFTESALHYRIAFGDDGGKPTRTLPPYNPGDHSIRGLYVWRRSIDLDSDLPEELATLLFDTMDRTYQTSVQAGDHDVDRNSPDIIPGGDGRPDIGTIQETYHTLFRYLKMSTLDGFSHEKPAPPEVFPNLDFPQLTDPHDDAPGEGDDDMSFWDWVLAILRFIFWLVAVAVWLATVLPGVIADLGSYGPRVLAYYTIELPLFMMLKAERAVMVMTGYFHPMQDEIDMGLVQIGNNNHGNFLNVLSSVDDILGLGLEVGASPAEPVPDAHFPHQTKFEDTGVLNSLLNKSSEEYHHPWAYPETPLELCHTFAGPWQSGDLPHKLLENAIPTNEGLVKKYAAAADPFETDMISFSNVTAEQNLGDPVNFSSFLIWQLARRELKNEVPNWNLDADRGYGYKCWDWNRQAKDGPAALILSDTEGHPYLAPCTPPPQTEETPGYNPDLPLKLYYLDREDPGCDIQVQCPDVKTKWPGRGNGMKMKALPRARKGRRKS
jgi:hypothetical protein